MKINKLYLTSILALSSFSAFAGEGLSDKGAFYFASMLGVAFASAFGAIGQSRAAAAALEGIARNPAASDKIFTPMLLSLALMESLVVFTLVTFFLIK